MTIIFLHTIIVTNTGHLSLGEQTLAGISREEGRHFRTSSRAPPRLHPAGERGCGRARDFTHGGSGLSLVVWPLSLSDGAIGGFAVEAVRRPGRSTGKGPCWVLKRVIYAIYAARCCPQVLAGVPACSRRYWALARALEIALALSPSPFLRRALSTRVFAYFTSR